MEINPIVHAGERTLALHCRIMFYVFVVIQTIYGRIYAEVVKWRRGK